MTGRAALAAVALSAAVAGAATLPSLSDADARRVDRGETVVHQRPVEGFPWPEVVTYRRSTASPTAVMAVYADFAAQSSWVPELVTSRVLAREAPNAFRVFYEYESPHVFEPRRAAVDGEADYLVTGDRGLLVLESYRRVKIVRPAHASYS
jgi:hypothetical protein